MSEEVKVQFKVFKRLNLFSFFTQKLEISENVFAVLCRLAKEYQFFKIKVEVLLYFSLKKASLLFYIKLI